MCYVTEMKRQSWILFTIITITWQINHYVNSNNSNNNIDVDNDISGM